MNLSQQPVYNPHKTLGDNLRPKPAETFLGHEINSRFGIAACPATMNAAYIRAAFENGFDVLTRKTERSVRYPANVFPNVLKLDVKGHFKPDQGNTPITGRLPDVINPEDLTIANSCGNNSEGPEYWIEDFRKALSYAGPGQLLIASVVGTIKDGFSSADYHDDFARSAGLAVEAGAPAVELNLSCPNVVGEGVLCYDINAVVDICSRVKERIGDVPIIIKLGYFTYNQEELLRDEIQQVAPYVAAVSASNTIPALIVDEAGKPAFPGPGRERAGVSGTAIKWAGIDMVNRLHQLRETLRLNYEIIGVGGVMQAKDYDDYRRVGADVVQAATGAMWNPDLAHEIKKAQQVPKMVRRHSDSGSNTPPY